MARLADLLKNVGGARVVSGTDALEIGEVRDDSRLVRAGDLFVAVPGSKQDGRKFIADAQAKGAAAILTEAEGVFAGELASKGTWILVPSARHALGIVAANRFAAASALTLTAVTGTNGKTTTTIWSSPSGRRGPQDRRHRHRRLPLWRQAQGGVADHARCASSCTATWPR
jgi:UDP-N-acetylmuramoyl-L-alanyl-D-glutamate--2,6-diaminopimelate ligase